MAGFHGRGDVGDELEALAGVPARPSHPLPPLRRQCLARGECVHGQHDAGFLEFSPQGVEIGKRRIAAVPEAGPYRRRLEAEGGHAPELGDGGLHALQRKDGAREEPPPIGRYLGIPQARS